MSHTNEKGNVVKFCTCADCIAADPKTLSSTMVAGVLNRIFNDLSGALRTFGVPYTEEYNVNVQKYLDNQLAAHFPLLGEANPQAIVEILEDGSVNGSYRFSMSAYSNTAHVDYSVKRV
jgi:hypothetical protein